MNGLMMPLLLCITNYGVLAHNDPSWFIFPLGVYATTVAMMGGLTKAGILQLPIDIRLGTQPSMDLAKWTKPLYVDRTHNCTALLESLGREGVNRGTLTLSFLLPPEKKASMSQS